MHMVTYQDLVDYKRSQERTPESKKALHTAKRKARLIWDLLLRQVRGGEHLQTLVVRCSKCTQHPMGCRCRHLVELQKGEKTWGIDERLAIGVEGLKALTHKDLSVRGSYIETKQRNNILDFVAHLQAVDPNQLLSID